MSDNELIFTFSESHDGTFEAHALGHSIFTQAETMAELEANVKEAVACHFAERKTLPTIRLVKVLPNTFKFGCAKGDFKVPGDFNDSDPEIEALFNNGPLFPE